MATDVVVEALAFVGNEDSNVDALDTAYTDFEPLDVGRVVDCELDDIALDAAAVVDVVAADGHKDGKLDVVVDVEDVAVMIDNEMDAVAWGAVGAAGVEVAAGHVSSSAAVAEVDDLRPDADVANVVPREMGVVNTLERIVADDVELEVHLDVDGPRMAIGVAASAVAGVDSSGDGVPEDVVLEDVAGTACSLAVVVALLEIEQALDLVVADPEHLSWVAVVESCVVERSPMKMTGMQRLLNLSLAGRA